MMVRQVARQFCRLVEDGVAYGRRASGENARKLTASTRVGAKRRLMDCPGASMRMIFGFLTFAVLALLMPVATAFAEDAGTRALVVGSEQDYPPFALGQTDAEADGFTVELWKAVAKEVGLKYTIRVRPFHQILQEFRDGKIDVLINLAQSDERRKFADFSIPHVTVNGAIFVRRGESGIRSEADLAGKSIIVLNADLAHDYALSRGWGKQLVLVDKAADGFRLLASGKHDALLISKLAGMQTLHEMKMSDIRALDAKAGFSQKFSFAVHKGDADLLAGINEGLSLSKPSGVYDALYEKWFGIYEEKEVTFLDVFRYLAPVALILLGFAGFEFYKRQIEHRRSEQELRQSEARFRYMLETSPIAVRIAGSGGRKVAFANKRYEELINAGPGQEIGADPKGYYACQEDYEEILGQLGKGEQVFNRLVELVIPGQGTKWALASYLPIVYEGKSSVLGWFYDITARKCAEEQLQLAARVFREAREAIMIADAGARIVDVNPTFTEITGYSREEAIGQNPRILNSGRHEPEFFAGMWAALREDGYWQSEIWNRRKNGELYAEQLTVSILRDEGGNPLYYVGLFSDITDRKNMEADLQHAKEAAEDVSRAKSEFLANMSHEIRTPMNAIMGLSKLALDREVSDDVRDYLQKISLSSESLLAILNDILDFSKMEAGKFVIEDVPFNLGNLQHDLYNLFSARAEEKHLDFHIDVDPDVPVHLLGDLLRIQQVLSNLLGNAIKFTERGSVALNVKLLEMLQSQVRLRFCVHDTGIGMREETRDTLFQPFSQADSSITRRFGGTGLGLAISHGLLQLMGSEFRVESEIGKGSRFCFDLQLGLATSAMQQEVNRRQAKRKAGALSDDLRERGKELRGSRVLVAEDNRINQQVVKEFLKLSGIEVDIASNGVEALEMIRGNAYDAVLMDVHMPEMGGVEATVFIRKQPAYASLPIIALTAGVTEDERASCFACGMNDFVAKPVQPEKLIEALTRWIRKD